MKNLSSVLRRKRRKNSSLFKGEYLFDFEALWATAKRISYQEIYEEAVKYLTAAQKPKIPFPDRD